MFHLGHLDRQDKATYIGAFRSLNAAVDAVPNRRQCGPWRAYGRNLWCIDGSGGQWHIVNITLSAERVKAEYLEIMRAELASMTTVSAS